MLRDALEGLELPALQGEGGERERAVRRERLREPGLGPARDRRGEAEHRRRRDPGGRRAEAAREPLHRGGEAPAQRLDVTAAGQRFARPPQRLEEAQERP